MYSDSLNTTPTETLEEMVNQLNKLHVKIHTVCESKNLAYFICFAVDANEMPNNAGFGCLEMTLDDITGNIEQIYRDCQTN